MKQIYLTLVAAAAIAFSSVEANAFTVNEIVGKYTATDMDFSDSHATFSGGTEDLTLVTWDDMEISILNGNHIKITNFIKKGIYHGHPNVDGVFDIEGDFDPQTNTITFQPTGYVYPTDPKMPFLGSVRPILAKYAEGDELEAIELVEDLKPFTATFDGQKNLTVEPFIMYIRSKDLLGVIRTGCTPCYKVGENTVNGFYFTNNDNSGIEGVVAEDNAPAEYYNLQGLKVENPEDGMYIRRQGGKATKVIVR